MLPETSVFFRTEDEKLQRVYDAAEEKCRFNLKDFGGDTVLVEGGGYEKIWLETQPMGGEMYALRSLEAARNNITLFMRHQRADGRLPGSIQCTGGKVEPQFNKYQGFCFPFPALNLYYLIGKDRDYLAELKESLIRFDRCLWNTRHVSGDGLLSSFCVYDTGEDLALRYGDAPCWWEGDEPPEGYQVVPMASMDVTSWSFAARRTVAEICRLQGDRSADAWERKARMVADALRRRLWDRKRGALYDRDRTGKTVDILCHNTLRCMYWGSISRGMAARFVKEHLLNPAEFRTPFPLPSVAVNDPAFRNAPENNWSGQPEGLTYQRAILALERYGYNRLVTGLAPWYACRIISRRRKAAGKRCRTPTGPPCWPALNILHTITASIRTWDRCGSAWGAARPVRMRLPSVTVITPSGPTGRGRKSVWTGKHWAAGNAAGASSRMKTDGSCGRS